MTAKIIFTPTADAGFRNAVERIREAQLGNPLQLVSILVPTAQTVLAVRRMLGDTFGVMIYQFYGLGQTILDAAGNPVHWLSDTAATRLVRHQLEQMSQTGELTSFARVWTMPGFQQTMVDWLREMKSQGIFPEVFAKHAATTRLERDQQLSILYTRYQLYLQDHQLSDSDGLLWLAAEAMDNDASLFGDRGLFLVLGFDQFNPIQERILKHLAARSTAFEVYLPWDLDRPESSLALARLVETRDQLKSALEPSLTVELEDDGLANEELRRLRQTLFDVQTRTGTEAAVWVDGDPVQAWEAPSREQEVRQALREIKRLLIQGVPADEIVLLAPQPDLYRRMVELTAEEYSVPVELEQPISANPAVQALLNVVELAGLFPWRQTLDALRSPYLRQEKLSPEQIELLDALSRETPVLQGREQWFFALEPAYFGSQDDVEDEDLGPPKLAQMQDEAVLIELRQGLEAYFDLLTPPIEADYREFALWLQETLLGLLQPVEDESDPVVDLPETLDMESCIRASKEFAERDLRAMQVLLRQLRELVEAAELVQTADNGRVRWEVFKTEFQEMVAGLLIPPELMGQAVRFDRLEAGRGQPTDHLYVLGLSEGEFPSQPAVDPIYTQEERRKSKLGLRQLHPAADASLWWLVVSNCRKSLTLFRPYIDENGALWEPSPYWEDTLSKACIQARVIPVAPVPVLAEAASLAELAVALANTGARSVPLDLEPAWRAALHAHEVSKKRQAWTPAPIYEGYLLAPDLQQEFASRYSERYTWSASRLNQYGMCPFGFYAQYVLKLEEQVDPVEGFDPMQRGSLLHAILERLHGRMSQQGLAMNSTQQALVLDLLDDVCDQIFARAPKRYGFRPSAVWQYEQAELRRLLNALIVWECEQESSFRPYQQELRFGLAGADLPHQRFVDSQGVVFYLHGVVDRIDRDESTGALRVLDYKSGSTMYSSSDLQEGRALQTPLYALAVEGLLRQPVRESAYVLIPKRELSGKLTSSDRMAANETAQQALDRAGYFVSEVRRGAFPNLPSKPAAGSMACSSYCSFASLCRVDRHAVAKARRVVQ